MEEDKSTKINSAFLEVKDTDLKGYERDDESKIRSIEKAAGISLGLVILGILVRTIMPLIPLPLGLLLRIILLAGTCMLGASIILAGVSLGWAFYYRQKTGFKFSNVIVTAVISIVISLIYILFNFTMIIAEFMV